MDKVVVYGITKISLEDDFLRYFDKKYELRQSIDYEENFGGLNALEYSKKDDLVNLKDYPIDQTIFKRVSRFNYE